MDPLNVLGKLLKVFDGLGDLSTALTYRNSKWTSTANIISFTFPCFHKQCHLYLNCSVGYWSTKISTNLDILNKKVDIHWPTNRDITLMTNTKLCEKHIYLKDPHELYINVSINEYSYIGHFSSHHMSYGGKISFISLLLLLTVCGDAHRVYCYMNSRSKIKTPTLDCL